MRTRIHADAQMLGRSAGDEAADAIIAAIRARGAARIVVATGASQFATLDRLVDRSDVDWARVDCFHLDEYIGIPETHPASFRRYLHERFVRKAGSLRSFHGVAGDAVDPAAECRRLGDLLAAAPVDVLLLGIGENGHLAFNDPPADMATTAPYHVVRLDEGCRRQQFGEGWFPSMDAVPRQAISMSMHRILSAEMLIASVPDARKAAAVRDSLEGPLTPSVPGSYLRVHGRCSLHIDLAAAGLLQPPWLAAAARS